MKVLQVCKFFPPVFGGIEQVAFDISDGLKKLHQNYVDILCVSNTSKSSLENWGYKIFRESIIGVLFSTPISFSYIMRWMKIRNDYDIVHVHLPNPLAVLALFLFRTKAKVVIHWHSDIVKQKKLLILFKPLQHWILKRSEKIIVTSDVYGKTSLSLREYQSKIISIPIGIEPDGFPVDELFYAELKEKFKGRKVVFSLGRLVYYKGFAFLIEAARNLPDDTVIIIGGEGELKKSLQEKISANNLDDKVFLVGGILYGHLSSYYMLCDIFCLPSIHESEAFGVVQLEAMSFKKPIVSTNIKNSGVPWVNKSGVSGIVVEPCDANALVDGIMMAIAQKDILSFKAYNRFLELFTKRKMVDDIYDLYMRLQ